MSISFLHVYTSLFFLVTLIGHSQKDVNETSSFSVLEFNDEFNA